MLSTVSKRSPRVVVPSNVSKAALSNTRVLLLTYQRTGRHYLFTGPQFVYFLKISKNDLPLFLVETFVLLFADDSNFVVSGKPDEVYIILKKVQNAMQIIIECMQVNKMQPNVEKTQMILIGKRLIVKSIGTVTVEVGSTKITSVKQIKSLGLIFDSELKWLEHVKLKARECNSIIWSLFPMQSSISQNNRKLIVNALI
jgi:hypothetical protein